MTNGKAEKIPEFTRTLQESVDDRKRIYNATKSILRDSFGYTENEINSWYTKNDVPSDVKDCLLKTEELDAIILTNLDRKISERYGKTSKVKVESAKELAASAYVESDTKRKAEIPSDLTEEEHYQVIKNYLEERGFTQEAMDKWCEDGNMPHEVYEALGKNNKEADFFFRTHLKYRTNVEPILLTEEVVEATSEDRTPATRVAEAGAPGEAATAGTEYRAPAAEEARREEPPAISAAPLGVDDVPPAPPAGSEEEPNGEDQPGWLRRVWDEHRNVIYIGGGIAVAVGLAALGLKGCGTKADYDLEDGEPRPKLFRIEKNPQYALENQDEHGNKTYTVRLSGKVVDVVYGDSGTQDSEFRKKNNLTQENVTVIIPNISEKTKKQYDKYNWKQLIGFDDYTPLGGSVLSKIVTRKNDKGKMEKVKVTYWNEISGNNPIFGEIIKNDRDRSGVPGFKEYEETLTGLENKRELLKRTHASKWEMHRIENDIKRALKDIDSLDTQIDADMNNEIEKNKERILQLKGYQK